ncbi:hypothetical protein [Stigmatella aurantiaca]|uniref:Conserved uncharacterized protein n=1 Tax=Stigmatella aurantiaca (strain DW4/3-1) TaxID=378806 RepID=Q08UY3_STIAD|nr:hypothetical protein [Stigmatella aurantiaca]ADO68816.1 conserved uncharacterized protein [Stigmatella aurantiaca DW4/3-1]EAU64274.1 hypothetical protein STIAU_0715 [Stigmatella aurantiaca DW4/3-1]
MISVNRNQPAAAAVARSTPEKPPETAAPAAVASNAATQQSAMDVFEAQGMQNSSADKNSMNTSSETLKDNSSMTSSGVGAGIVEPSEIVDLGQADLSNPSTVDDLSKTFGVEGVKLAKRVSDSEFDGALVGVDKTIKLEDLGGKKDQGPVKLDDIEGFTPKNSHAQRPETIIQINGINTNLSEQKTALQATADATGAKVVGIHNATDGFIGDLAQSVGDKTNLGKNLAVDSLRDTVLSELRAGKNVHLMAHSQGGLITSRALGQVADELKKEGKSDLLYKVKAETFGAASGRYPDGPRYVHYINKGDPVSNVFGVEGKTSFMNHPGKDAMGRDARIVGFSDKSGIAAHNYNDVYLNHRKDFDLMYHGPGLVVQDPNRPRPFHFKPD